MKEVAIFSDKVAKYKVYCKCGHSILIKPRIDRVICHHCGNYVYRTKQIEFRYKLKNVTKC